MDANTFAILVLLGSFFLMIFLRFPMLMRLLFLPYSVW